jgi:hypothetical protein
MSKRDLASEFGGLFVALDEAIAAGQSVTRVLTGRPLQALLQSAQVARASGIVRSAEYSAKENAAIYNEIKSAPVATIGAWELSVSTADERKAYIYSVPQDTVIVNLSDPATEPLEIDQYEVCGPVEDLSRSDEIRVRLARSTSLSRHQSLYVASGRSAIDFSNRTDAHLLLSFRRSGAENYILCFKRDDLALGWATYSNATCNDHMYFGQVCEALFFDAGFRSGLSADEVEGVCRLLETSVLRAELPVEIRWRFLRILASVDPERAVPGLEELSQCHNQAIAALATRGLTALVQRTRGAERASSTAGSTRSEVG